VFLTDFLGWCDGPLAGLARGVLDDDYNAQMLAQVARFKRVRDRALYIGDYDDLLPERFGPDLPFIPDWARNISPLSATWRRLTRRTTPTPAPRAPGWATTWSGRW